MGLYVNPGTAEYQTAIDSEIFVDKTLLIKELNRVIGTTLRYVCVSRPRRFGKTVAESMLCAYYSKNADCNEQFKNLRIANYVNPDSETETQRVKEQFLKYKNAFNVIKIDCNAFTKYVHKEGEDSFVNKITKTIKSDFIKEFPDIDFSDCSEITECISKVYQIKGERFVIILDEYDLEVRMRQKQSLHQEYLDLLVTLFKNPNLSPAIALAYLTGILPIVRDKFESKLNNFTEVSMLSVGNYAQYTGFTEEEVKELCESYQMDFDECKHWYDGYNLKQYSIFNPKAIVEAMIEREYKNRWTRTGSYEAISDYLYMNFEGIKDNILRMIAGERVDVFVKSFCNSLDSFTNKDDVFTYLIHLGYLAYDEENEQCYIPNKEIREEWVIAMGQKSEFNEAVKLIKDSKNLLKLTLQGDEEAVAIALDKTHEMLTSNLSYNNEQSLQSAICFAYFFARSKYSVFCEMPAGKGYADVVFIPLKTTDPAIIIELKRNSSTGNALKQIEEKKYFNCLDKYHGNLILVGVNYDDNKKHTCEIRRFDKGQA